MALTEKLSAIGDAIRAKTGTTEKMTLDGMVTAIEGIETGGGSGSDSLNAFIDRSITEVSNDEVTEIGKYAFDYCKDMTSASFSAVTEINGFAFGFCESLVSVDFPMVRTIGDSAFYYSTSMESVYFPCVTLVGSKAFRNCTSLAKVDLPVAKTIGIYAFDKSALECLILRNEDALCVLEDTNSLESTPIASGTGYIYVPATLVDSYKADSVWSAYANQIRAIEDYPEICGLGGNT